MPGTPLPALSTAQADYAHMKDGDSDLLSAYNLVLEAERRASDSHANAQLGHQSTSKNLICARVIGWFLLHPVGDNRVPFLSEISSTDSSDDVIDKIYTLGGLYLHYIIPLCTYLLAPPHVTLSLGVRRSQAAVQSSTPKPE